MPLTDAELLIASRDDPAAFRELYDRWADRLLACFYRRVLDPEVAADLLAETFAVAFERRRRFRDVGRPGASSCAWSRRWAARRSPRAWSAPRGRAAEKVEDASGERCFTRSGLKAMARDRLATTGRRITFAPYPSGIIPGGLRGERRREGCAIIAGLSPTRDGYGIEVQVQD